MTTSRYIGLLYVIGKFIRNGFLIFVLRAKYESIYQEHTATQRRKKF